MSDLRFLHCDYVVYDEIIAFKNAIKKEVCTGARKYINGSVEEMVWMETRGRVQEVIERSLRSTLNETL